MLKAAYVFLRNLEHKLQMVHELQTHVIPSKTEEIGKCAVRMGYLKDSHIEHATQTFLEDFRRHTCLVHRTYEHIIGS